MFGYCASKVKFNYDDVGKRLYCKDLRIEWEEAMKGAILNDCIKEEIEPEQMRVEQCHRYVLACEEVIDKLLFSVKWGKPPQNTQSNEDIS